MERPAQRLGLSPRMQHQQARIQAAFGPTSPAAQQHPLQLAYREEFDGPSMGTEQELSGVKLAKTRDAVPLIAQVMHGDEVLIEITTDIGGAVQYRDSALLDYTLEIKTTPTEASDRAGWALRTDAIDTVVVAINSMGAAGGKLRATDAPPGCVLQVLNDNHWAHLEDDGSRDISGSADQLTLGLPVSAIGGDTPEALAMAAQAFWFNREYADQEVWGEPPLPVQARNIYNYVLSVIAQLARLTEAHKLFLETLDEAVYNRSLLDSDVKNAWAVLPRTPPWETLDVLADPVEGRVRDKLNARANVTDAPGPVWDAARRHIRDRGPLAGHEQATPRFRLGADGAGPDGAAPTEQGALFEFRDVPGPLRRTPRLTPDGGPAVEGQPRFWRVADRANPRRVARAAIAGEHPPDNPALERLFEAMRARAPKSQVQEPQDDVGDDEW